MSELQVDSGRSSSATHRITQASTTLNRRYVRRPANIAIQEAARAAEREREMAEKTPVMPSRLVNLRVHAAELEAAKAKAKAAEKAAENQASANVTTPINPIAMYPKVLEFGRLDPEPTEVYEQISAEMRSENQPMASADPAATISNQMQTPATLAGPSVAEPEITVAHEDSALATAAANTVTSSAPEIDTATLAMNIAADYAAASLGASVKEYGKGYDAYAMAVPEGEVQKHPDLAGAKDSDSVDAIARAASEAIASIRQATEPEEVSEQVASLKAFADNIKVNHNTPEMRELGDTIEKFVSIAMKSSKVQEETECKVAAKVTLSPKVTRAAAKVTKSSAKVMAASSRSKSSSTAKSASRNVAKTNPSVAMRRNNTRLSHRRPTPEELKDRAIQQALESVATMDEDYRSKSKGKRQPAMRARRKGGARRFAIAFVCAAACVGGIIYYVTSNIPDISVRVAAMQTGISATYPSYVPRDYSLGDIKSENEKIEMVFNGPDGASFILTEEKSTWDSAALLSNYVEPVWGENYATTHEQGITIYISNQTSDAAWVNSGVLYTITSSGTALTKKQVRSIVVSL